MLTKESVLTTFITALNIRVILINFIKMEYVLIVKTNLQIVINVMVYSVLFALKTLNLILITYANVMKDFLVIKMNVYLAIQTVNNVQNKLITVYHAI